MTSPIPTEGGHTPGPWKYEQGTHAWRGFTVITAPSMSLPSSPLAALSNVLGAEECEPDARLIAAAPALLEALKSIVTAKGWEVSPEKHATALAALAQATGGDQ